MRKSTSDFIEARINGHLEKVGSVAEAYVRDGFVYGKRFALTFRPVPTLGHFDAKAWLRRQFLVYTHQMVSDSCSSSTSYCCRFMDCGDISELDAADMTLMQDVVFEIGKVRE